MKEKIEYRGFTLEVDFDHYKARPGDMENPPEPAEIEITSIRLLQSNERVNITGPMVFIDELLCSCAMKAIEVILWEKLREKDECDPSD